MSAFCLIHPLTWSARFCGSVERRRIAANHPPRVRVIGSPSNRTNVRRPRAYDLLVSRPVTVSATHASVGLTSFAVADRIDTATAQRAERGQSRGRRLSRSHLKCGDCRVPRVVVMISSITTPMTIHPIAQHLNLI